MNIFEFRDRLIGDYASYIESFIQIRTPHIHDFVERQLQEGMLWPDPLIQLNPLFAPGESIDELVARGTLHRECARIFRKDKTENGQGRPLRLHKHQSEAISVARSGASYVLTTGTGSGKSLAYIVPIVDYVLRHGSGKGIQAIVVYPMNALANSQLKELEKFLCQGYPDRKGPVTFERYTGQESEIERERIRANPPDILLTNYVMMELILTRSSDVALIHSAALRFLVLDELHTYRGRQGADVALLVRRVQNRMAAGKLQFVGTSATLAGVGTYEERRSGVATMASRMFGTVVRPEQVIGETLTRTTSGRDEEDPDFVRELAERVRDAAYVPPRDYQSFITDPLSTWIENTFGVQNEGERLVRTMPKSISREREGAAAELSRSTGVPIERCIVAIQEALLAGYECEPHPETSAPPFAFRLHQFISKGDTMYASLASKPYLTLQSQQYVPGDRERVLLPLVFCRECGQEYYCVRLKDGQFFTRALNAQQDDEGEPGFLYFSSDNPWPLDQDAIEERLPDEWLEETRAGFRVRRNRREDLPRPMSVRGDGVELDMVEGDANVLDCHFVPAPFRFCMHCGVSYGARQTDDFAKLASLSSEGRSTATTILSLSAMRSLRDTPIKNMPPKMLSFTDNRQDASLQAGHFNDFIEVGLLRSALYKAVREAGEEGLRHENLTQKVFDALDLDMALYASDPNVKYQALAETKRALRNVLGYRLYRDLKRGWRITSPNLEQAGLLRITYLSLEEVCHDEDVWSDCHPALSSASPETRTKVGTVLLDFMRRELALKVDYLDQLYQESMQQQSSQRLVAPWALDENESKEYATVLYARPRGPGRDDYGGNVFLSSRGGFGQYLRRRSTFKEYAEKQKLGDTDTIIEQLLEGLSKAGLVECVVKPAKKDEQEKAGYQLTASSLIWQAGDGKEAYHDPIRVPRVSVQGQRTNAFFVDFYSSIAAKLQGLEAREHTAQVPYQLRMEREDKFREGKLPILYCSPTMELGVDIAELNVVNMRNMPPTPANYAQRSGRAGRSGQPALVFSYCSTGSPHDQYFFKRPDQMVAGAVTPPRLDLANEDLVRAHVHAIWLAETGLNLGRSLKDILEISGEKPTLALQGHVRESIENGMAKGWTRASASKILDSLQGDLHGSDWYTENWLDEVLAKITTSFDRTCERWRGLYRAAQSQAEAQDSVIRDASRSAEDKKQADRLRSEAESQLVLLTDVESLEQSDFYSYRYFASEGFLPGYNFPRLPLSAYIPGRRTKQRDEYLSRPRFLAISEFGPRAIVYHEGSRYLINRVIRAVEEDEDLPTREAKQCEHCGYLHPVSSGRGLDLCERCGTKLGLPLQHLFRLQNVATKRRDKINSDEEERMRLGYEIRTAVRFGEHEGRPSYRTGMVQCDEEVLATLTYGHAATLWRINLGWMRRKDKSQHGFVLDKERGYWEKNNEAADDPDDPLSARTERVIPYVEDRRNCMLFQPEQEQPARVMASLQAILKSALQVKYQLEDNELAAEPMPNDHDRQLILLYESAEGGAGVLRRLLDERQALAEVAREALRLCHFDPDTGDDLRRAPRAQEDCEAACYDCLMNYYNQREHRLLDRQAIRALLLSMARSHVVAGPTEQPRSVHLAQLQRQAGSELERSWLQLLEQHGQRLPSHVQRLVESCGTRPDFYYQDYQAAIYIDGHYHDYAERRKRDEEYTECLEDQGYTVIRFAQDENWDEKIARYPHIFGRRV